MTSYQLISENVGTIFDNPGIIFRCPITFESSTTSIAGTNNLSYNYTNLTPKSSILQVKGYKRVGPVDEVLLFTIPKINSSSYLVAGELSGLIIVPIAADTLVSSIKHRIRIDSIGTVTIFDGYSYTFSGYNACHIRVVDGGVDGTIHVVLRTIDIYPYDVTFTVTIHQIYL